MQHISNIRTSINVKATKRILRFPQKTRPAIYLLEAKSGSVVVKDYKAGDSSVRALLGRILVLREKKAYIRLGPMRGLASFICTPDAFSICTGFIQGKRFDELMKNGGPPVSFYKELSKLIESLHKKGMVHCDLKRASNIILDNDGRPVILDWAASIAKNEARLFPLTFLYKCLEVDDKKAVTKFMLKASPHLVGKDQAAAYMRRSRAERIIRLLRDALRNILQHLC